MALDKNFNPVLRFMVVSDIHVKDEPDCPERLRFAKALDYAYEIAESSDTYKKLDAVYINGDFANKGTQIQMTAVKQILDEKLRPGTIARLTMASHEYFCEGGEETARRRFTEIFDQPFCTHEVINGFHFIAMTSTKGCRFFDTERAYAKAELAKAAADDSKKPIFFFQHPHLSDTVYGSISWGEDDLNAILYNYPQIIDFSGHSHAPINDPRSIHQKYLTSLGSGTLSYFELDEFDKVYGTIPPKNVDAAQMLIVEADKDNRVRVYLFDVLTGKFFPQVRKIDVPSDPSTFTYTDERYKTTAVPAFADDAVLAVEASETSANISFTQAMPDAESDYVNYYTIVLRRKADNAIVKQVSIWSEYYFMDMPKTLSQQIEDLAPATEYTVEIIPEGFFKNRGTKTLKGAFSTK